MKLNRWSKLMFQNKLNSIKSSLTKTENKIADYLIHHMEEAKTSTSQELAQTLGIGQSTIIRFSKKMGYLSFRELLADLSSSANKIELQEVDENESTKETMKKIMMQMQEIVSLTLADNKLSEIEKAVDYLKNAEQIILFGIESSNLYAKYLANQLTKMGFLCLTSDSSHTTHMQIENACENTVLFLVSETGKTIEVLNAAKLAKEKGIVVISLTRKTKNPLYEYSDIILKTVAFDTVTRLNVTTMRASQLYIIDVLYILIMKSDMERYNANIERAERLTFSVNKVK